MFEASDVQRDVRGIPRWLADDLGLSPDTALDGWRTTPGAMWRRRRDPFVHTVEQVPLFSTLARRRQRLVARLVTPLHIRERTVVASAGSPAREFVVVVDGTLDVVDDDRVVATRGPGSHAGAASLLANRPRETSLVAATPVLALVASEREFARLLDEVPEVCERLHADIGRAALDGLTPERAA